MYKINVIDSICGSGKTQGMINYINSSPSYKKFLYVTPFLTEVDRIKRECPLRRFKTPPALGSKNSKSYGSKLYGLKFLIEKGENIVATHSLFSMFDEELLDIAYLNDYTLVMDEVADVVDFLSITPDDLETLLEKYTEVKDRNRLVWTAKKYRGEFHKYKRLCELGCVYLYRPDKKSNILLWMFPISIFKAFKEIYLLTYFFDAQMQKYYYDYYGLQYNYLYVTEDYKITDKPVVQDLSIYRRLINICEHPKLNQVGDLDGSLSFSWYHRNVGNLATKTLKNNSVNFFKHITKTPSQYNMWTTFKEFRKDIKGDGYAKGFIHINMRATNDYLHKKSVAYLVNKYLNPVIKNFFISNGVIINEDKYALSELLQFIFRSQVRNGKPIDLYLPSRRMRNILKRWFDENEKCLDK